MAEFTPPEVADPAPELPTDAEHIIVCSGKFDGPQPEGLAEGNRVLYEQGDEVPFEQTAPFVSDLPGVFAVLDADGDVLLGEDNNGCAEAVRQWRTRDVFDPSEYESSND